MLKTLLITACFLALMTPAQAQWTVDTAKAFANQKREQYETKIQEDILPLQGRFITARQRFEDALQDARDRFFLYSGFNDKGWTNEDWNDRHYEVLWIDRAESWRTLSEEHYHHANGQYEQGVADYDEYVEMRRLNPDLFIAVAYLFDAGINQLEWCEEDAERAIAEYNAAEQHYREVFDLYPLW